MNFPGKILQPFGKIYQTQILDIYSDIKKIKLPLHSSRNRLNTSQTIALYQPVLYSIALKMVNSFADAEDIVQETFLKWLTIDKKKIINTKSYLVKAVTNNCLNHLESLKKKKEDLFDKVNPRILKEMYREFDFGRFDLEFDISTALSVIHKKLKPLEKAVYLLREVFDLDYDNLNEIFDKSQENCRQLFCRAKEKLNLENIKLDKKALDNPGILDSFKKACNFGHLTSLINDLKRDIYSKNFNNLK